MLVKTDMLLGDEIDALGRKGNSRKLVQPSEAMVQRAIIQMCQFNGVMAVHVPNEAKRSMLGHVRAKMDGLRVGFPDLLLYRAGGKHALFEVKAPTWKAPQPPKPGRKPSKAYSKWADRIALYERLRGYGFEVEVVQSVDDARRYLRAWGWAR
ncbi:MAG TPA: VRR-NUC domain-containing protein [Roseococcus sp.]|nr:VRR-NUC domain-containing protein [Roseococcus sp.]